MRHLNERGALAPQGWGSAHLLALTLVLGAGVWCLGPPFDPDIWWHLRTGEWILDNQRLPGVDRWSLTAEGNSWIAHAWLSQVILALFHDLAGTTGISLFRCLAVSTLLSALTVQAFRRTTPARALLVSVLALMGTFGGWGERPQLLSFLLLIPMAELIRRAVAGRLSMWWGVPLTYLWANLHGLWFLGPALIALGAVGAVEATKSLRAMRPYLACALASVAVAGLTPNGPELVVQPLKINGYGQFVNEWAAPSIRSVYGFAMFTMVAAFLVAYGRRSERVSAYTLAQLVFALVLGLMYIRTVAPAVVLLVPLLADAVGRRPADSRRGFPPRVAAAFAAALVVGALGGATVVLRAFPDLPPGAPVDATRALTEAVPGEQRVINEYDLGGWLLYMAPTARPAIDGRTEIYPLEYVSDYLLSLKMSGDWRKTLAPLRANAALLRRETPLVNGLQEGLRWRTVYEDDTWIVLIPPEALVDSDRMKDPVTG